MSQADPKSQAAQADSKPRSVEATKQADPVEPVASWKKRADNVLIGTRIPRLDAVEKATGTAKFTSDINSEGTLFAKCLTCIHAAAKVKALDVTAARNMPGVHAVHVFADVGAEIKWDGMLIAGVAAETLSIAAKAVEADQVRIRSA